MKNLSQSSQALPLSNTSNNSFANLSLKVIGLGLIGIIASCTQIIEIDIPAHEPQWVLNGFIIADENDVDEEKIINFPNEFLVSRSQSIFERNNIEPVDNARIFITDGNGNSIATSQAGSQGPYRPLANYQANQTYRVRSEMPNGDEGPSIQLKTPKKIDVTSSSIREGSRQSIISLSFNDPADEENFYFIGLIQEYIDTLWNGDVFRDFGSVYFNILHPDFSSYYESDPFFPNESTNKGVLSDRSFNGQSLSLEIRIDDSWWGGERNRGDYYVVLVSMGKDMHQFMLSFYENWYNDFGPFSEPSPFFFNVENGLGTVVSGTRSIIHIK